MSGVKQAIDFNRLSKIITDDNSILIKDVYFVLGYSRADNFARLLKNPKYDYGTIYYELGETPKWISIRLFFDLVNKHLQWNEEWDTFFSEVWTSIYESKMINFIKANHKSEYRHSCYDFKVAGKYYTYSLTAYNIADSNDLCPYDVYKHCATEYVSWRDKKIWQVKYDSPILSIFLDGSPL